MTVVRYTKVPLFYLASDLGLSRTVNVVYVLAEQSYRKHLCVFLVFALGVKLRFLLTFSMHVI